MDSIASGSAELLVRANQSVLCADYQIQSASGALVCLEIEHKAKPINDNLLNNCAARTSPLGPTNGSSAVASLSKLSFNRAFVSCSWLLRYFCHQKCQRICFFGKERVGLHYFAVKVEWLLYAMII